MASHSQAPVCVQLLVIPMGQAKKQLSLRVFVSVSVHVRSQTDQGSYSHIYPS